MEKARILRHFKAKFCFQVRLSQARLCWGIEQIYKGKIFLSLKLLDLLDLKLKAFRRELTLKTAKN